MKRKKLLPLIITAGAAVVMIAGYLIYTSVSSGESESGKTVLFSAESMREISFTYEGEQLAFIKKDGTWVYEADEHFPLNSAFLRDMENALVSVEAAGEIETGDPAEYGLQSPSRIIKAAATDGNVFDCEVGDDNETANVVYVRTGGSIYMLDIGFSKVFSHTLEEMAQRQELLDVQPSEVSGFTLTNEKGSFKLLHYPDGIPGRFKKLTWAFADGSPADAKGTNELISAVAGMRAEQCVSYKPDASRLESYGLTKPAAAVGISYDGGEFKMQIGGRNANGLCYVWLPDAGLVYTFKADVPELLMSTASGDCINREVFPVEYSGLTYAEVNAGGISRQMDFKSYGKAWDFYYALSNMRAERFAKEGIAGGADVTITAHTADPNVKYTIAFKKYNDDFYSTDFLGLIQLVNKRDVEELLNILQA